MRLCVRGEGPLVVKLAGLVGGVGIFDEEIGAAAAEFRVAALDTSGDRADDPAPAPLTWDLLAGEVLAAVERLGEPAVLWGTSFGSLVCLAAAARRPEAVRGLLLCFPPEPGWAPHAWVTVLRACRRSVAPDRAAARAFHAGFLALTGWEMLLPAALARIPRTWRAARDAATPARTIARKLALLWLEAPVPVPPGVRVSIIAGGLDTVAPLAGARRLAARITRSRLRILRLAGHAGTFSRPRTYARWSLEELRALTRH
jgi:pimeloyl-ACP methyl ester carboxylesterase